jgi:hypothetical protein
MLSEQAKRGMNLRVSAGSNQIEIGESLARPNCREQRSHAEKVLGISEVINNSRPGTSPEMVSKRSGSPIVIALIGL